MTSAAASTSSAASASTKSQFTLTFQSNVDRPGIVAKIASTLASNNLNIVESAQFGDPSTKGFYLRTAFVAEAGARLRDLASVQAEFEPIGRELDGQLDVWAADDKPRILIMVSKIGHALNDLLFRAQNGQLPVTIVAIVSNHPDFADVAKTAGIPFHHLPVSKDTKAEAERRLLEIVETEKVKLVVMARYMQILSSRVCEAVDVINVHHGMLPALCVVRCVCKLMPQPRREAMCDHQAYDHGVKLVGATSHFATADLDEGPIIEQDLVRVTHSMDAQALTHAGSTIESTVLARAVKWWAEHRVFRNGRKTVVFS